MATSRAIRSLVERRGYAPTGRVNQARALTWEQRLTYTIVVLPGDGIGPEVTAEAVKVLAAVGERFGHRFQLQEAPRRRRLDRRAGRALLRRDDGALRCGRRRAARRRWRAQVGRSRGGGAARAGPVPPAQGPGLFTNLRPVRLFPACSTPRRSSPSAWQGIDLLIVRELTGGLYFGQPQGATRRNGHARPSIRWPIPIAEIERVLRVGLSSWPSGGASGSPRSTRPTCWPPRGCGARSPRAWRPSTPT